VKLRPAGFRGGMVAVVTEDRIAAVVRAIGEWWCKDGAFTGLWEAAGR
jgi:hypothetical protein